MPLTHPAPSAWRVDVTRPVSWEVHRIDHVLDKTFPPPPDGAIPDPLGRVPGGSLRRAVVVDHNVLRYYGDKIAAYLTRHGIEYRIIPIPGGEHAKAMPTVMRLSRQLDDWGLDRFGEPIIMFVPGTGSDAAGLAAHLLRRGIRRITYPTSGVAGIDASIGLKVAVDLGDAKNRLGAYDPSHLVIIDRTFWATLPRERHSDMLGEIVKLGLAVDASIFASLQAHGRLVLDEGWQGVSDDGDKAAVELLDASIGATLGQLEPNPWEDDAARPLYAGHTWSPAVEMAALRASRRILPWRRRPALRHGKAVALDLLLSCGISLGRGLLTTDDYYQVAELLDALELPCWDPLLADPTLMAAGFADTIRHRGARQLTPLFDGIGQVTFANDITTAEINRALARQRSVGARMVA